MTLSHISYYETVLGCAVEDHYDIDETVTYRVARTRIFDVLLFGQKGFVEIYWASGTVHCYMRQDWPGEADVITGRNGHHYYEIRKTRDEPSDMEIAIRGIWYSYWPKYDHWNLPAVSDVGIKWSRCRVNPALLVHYRRLESSKNRALLIEKILHMIQMIHSWREKSGFVIT